MGLGIAILIMVVYFLWRLERGVNRFKDNIEKKVATFLDYKAGFKALLHIFDWFKSRKSKED